ncbi:uncharacterized protein LOC113851976 [Abrus precatorius]|uniref:Uncharacterized protein LOC113851976 n=1 Tax=Abrus precatorius TaxID=3816 RepID=A0A8B8K4N9_ABRPR|nr:uncharacterized protein LOC113851976 [Abrus precatorius]
MKRIAIATILIFLETCYALPIHHCHVSSCGNIANISYPFRLKSDPLGCGDKRYELDCENNATVLTLFSGKYNVQQIDYKRYKIRVSDAGVVEDATCSFMPQYFLYSANFTQFIIGPGPDPLKLDQNLVSIAYFNCTNRITDDSRYVEVDTTGCGFGGHMYAVVKDSSNGFGVKDIKVGCEMKVATLANWGTMQHHKTHRNVSLVDIRNVLSRGFGLSWLNVICEDLCGEGKDCRVVNESTGEVQCDALLQDCRYFYTADQVTYDCGLLLDMNTLTRGISNEMTFLT